MKLIAMKTQTLSTFGFREGTTGLVRWVVRGGLLLLLVGAVVQCAIERENARIASVQTYNLERVAAFRDSGVILDEKVAAFSYAAAEGRSLTEPRQAVRSALADHAAKTMGMQDAFGVDATEHYNQELKRLQAAIEETSDATNSGAIISALSRVVVNRNELSKKVTMKATG